MRMQTAFKAKAGKDYAMVRDKPYLKWIGALTLISSLARRRR
jgi:hypothetical protein